MGRRPHFMADTWKQTRSDQVRRAVFFWSCWYWAALLCLHRLLPPPLQMCVRGRCSWHRVAMRRWQSGEWSQPDWPPGWCFPGPQFHLECLSSPGGWYSIFYLVNTDSWIESEQSFYINSSMQEKTFSCNPASTYVDTNLYQCINIF